MAFGQDVATMTPGSAVADSLEDILTRKRNEARQSMLDSITKQSAQARANYENQSAASLAEQRDAMAQFRKSQADENWLKGLGSNPAAVDQATYQRGAALSPGSFRMTPAQPTLPSTSITDAGTKAVPSVNSPAIYQYLGSQQYQQRQDTTKALQDLANDPTFANLDPIHKELRLAAALPQYNPEGAASRILTSKADQAPGHEYVVDPANPSKRIDLGVIGPNDKVNVLSREPRDPASLVTPQLLSSEVPNDPNDPSKGTHQESRWIMPNQTWEQGKPITGGLVVKGPLKPAKTVAETEYDPKAYGAFQSTFKNAKATPGSVLSARAAFINSLKDPSIRKDVSDAIQYATEAKQKNQPVPTVAEMEQRGMISPPQGHKDPVEYMNKLKSFLTMAGLQ